MSKGVFLGLPCTFNLGLLFIPSDRDSRIQWSLLNVYRFFTLLFLSFPFKTHIHNKDTPRPLSLGML